MLVAATLSYGIWSSVPIEHSFQFCFSDPEAMAVCPAAIFLTVCIYIPMDFGSNWSWGQSQHSFYFQVQPGLQRVGQDLILPALDNMTSCKFRVLRTVSYVLRTLRHKSNTILFFPSTTPWWQDPCCHSLVQADVVLGTWLSVNIC